MQRLPKQAKAPVALLEFVLFRFVLVQPWKDTVDDDFSVPGLWKINEDFHDLFDLQLERLSKTSQRECNFTKFVLIEIESLFQFIEQAVVIDNSTDRFEVSVGAIDPCNRL